jgi:site-specific recombinase XerD
MTSRVEEYLQYRRSLGYALRIEGELLLNFGRYADQFKKGGPLTSELATRWARLPAQSDRLYWSRRIEILIGLARYLKIFDPRTEIPSRYIFGPAHRRNTPYIYSPSHIRKLVEIASQQPSKDLLRTHATVIGLLACSGLRVSEALNLLITDVDLEQGILIVRESKRRRLRLVPLHHSTIQVIRDYNARRAKRFPGASFFFVNHSGHRLSYSTIRGAFQAVVRKLGLTHHGKRPRLYDLRHTFATRVLLKWHRRQPGREDRIDWLSRYLGHEQVSDTYWYFTATPQLFHATARCFVNPNKRIPK